MTAPGHAMPRLSRSQGGLRRRGILPRPQTALFPHHLTHHGPIPGPGVKLDQDDLLPGPQGHLSADDGHGQRGTQEGGAHMRVTVVVMPGLFVLVASRLGGKAFESRLEIVIDETGLEFRRGNPRRRAHVEDRDNAVVDVGL